MNKGFTTETEEKLLRGIYKGKIYIIENPQYIKKTVAIMVKYNVLGFDTETKPSFQKGTRNKVSLLQFYNSEAAFLFRINKTGFHPTLVKLFEDESVLKVGIGIRDDLFGLKKLKNFNPGGFLDLQSLAPKYGFSELSLKGLAAETLKLRISKRQRLTNWEADKLTNPQIIYAATDAWIALSIYNKFKMIENIDSVETNSNEIDIIEY